MFDSGLFEAPVNLHLMSGAGAALQLNVVFNFDVLVTLLASQIRRIGIRANLAKAQKSRSIREIGYLKSSSTVIGLSRSSTLTASRAFGRVMACRWNKSSPPFQKRFPD